MVSTIIALLGFLLFGACSARADLDLSPTEGVRTLEDAKVRQIVFHDGAREITYQPPRGWTFCGDSNSVVFSIPEHPQAKAFIRSAARLRIPAFDDKAAKLFHDNPALLQLPRGAKDVRITALAINPLVMDSHPTLEVQVSYSFFGQACARSILLVNRNGAELSFTLDCGAPDFQALHQIFRASLYSFENL
jgi:hypothetical protein